LMLVPAATTRHPLFFAYDIGCPSLVGCDCIFVYTISVPAIGVGP
jgi:hypothetical protein